MSPLRAAWIPAALLLLGGCGGEDTRTDPRTLTRRPAAYDPAAFPDLPLEILRGYRLDAEHEPLAVAYAGGALRRFNVVFISGEATDERPREVLDRLAGGLADRGWTRVPAPEDGPDRWRKADEQLALDAETDDGRLLVTWNLTKAL